jgi:transaldolase
MNPRAFRIKLFQDSADIDDMLSARANAGISGFTTNPTLMRKAGVGNYRDFARRAIGLFPDLPISFEVVFDDFPTMEREARDIAGWGGNIYVKIPVTNTKGESSAPLIGRLSRDGISVNATAVFTLEQVEMVAEAIDARARTIVSVFAGRIADTGVDPVPIMKRAVEILKPLSNAELLWASPREVLNVVQAECAGCHIITLPPEIIAKLPLLGKDLREHSLDTVRMFYDDARAASYTIV